MAIWAMGSGKLPWEQGCTSERQRETRRGFGRWSWRPAAIVAAPVHAAYSQQRIAVVTVGGTFCGVNSVDLLFACQRPDDSVTKDHATRDPPSLQPPLQPLPTFLMLVIIECAGFVPSSGATRRPDRELRGRRGGNPGRPRSSVGLGPRTTDRASTPPLPAPPTSCSCIRGWVGGEDAASSPSSTASEVEDTLTRWAVGDLADVCMSMRGWDRRDTVDTPSGCWCAAPAAAAAAAPAMHRLDQLQSPDTVRVARGGAE